jgi:O-antigen ligase
MYYEAGINGYLKDIIKGKVSFSVTSLIILALISGLFFYITFTLQQGIVAFAIIISLLLLYLIINYPRIWIYTVAGLSFLYFKETSEGISVIDYATAVLYSGSLIAWIVWMKLVNRVKIADSSADWLLIFFFVAFIFNFIVAAANGNDLLGCLREALKGIIMLYFIPIKYYFKDRNDLKRLLIIFAISIIISALWQFYDYYKTLKVDAVYLYQLATSVRQNQAVFSAATVFGFSFLIYYRKIKNQIFLFILTSLAFAGLFTSFSRSFWLVIALNILILFLFVPVRKKIKILSYSAIALSLLVIVMFNILGDKSKYMVQIVENRIGSSFQGKKDISVDMRLTEYRSVYRRINENPLGGNGMGSKIKFYHSGNKATTITHNIHNSYLYTAQRYGIPMAICFFSAMILYLFKSFKLALKIKDQFDKMLILAAFNTMLMLLITSFVTAIHYYRDGMVTTAVTIAVIGIIEMKYKSQNTGNSYGN